MQVSNSIYLWSLLLICLCNQLKGQGNDVHFDKLTSSHGLSHNTVYSIIQDDPGFIWVGTKSGLNRFDGYDFKTFHIPNGKNINTPNPTVFSLLMDKNGLIWIGMKEGGLVAYDPVTDQFKRFPFDENATVDWSTITVKSIYEDSRRWLWIGTFGGGAIVLNENRQVIYHFCTYCNAEKKEQLSNDFVFDFQEDAHGNVYIATAGKGLNIFSFKTKNIRTIHATNEEDLNSFSKTICLDDSERLWVGTEGNGLYAYDTRNENWTTYRVNALTNSISSNIITDIQLDKKGQLWVATDGGGLNQLNLQKEEFQNFQYNSTHTHTLNTDALYHLQFDKSDNLWIGTFNGGLNILKAIQPPFYTKRQYDEEKKIGLRSVLSVREDNNGRVWLGTDGGGVFYFDVNAESLVLQNASRLLQNGQFNDVITCIQPDGDQGFWHGSFANGLNYFDFNKGSIRQFLHDENNPQSLIHNNVWDLEMDKEGGLWIGTLGGGIDYLPKGATVFQHFGNFEGELSDVQVVDLLLDEKEESLWIATESKGLNRLNIKTKTIQKYLHGTNAERQISSNNIRTLLEDELNTIWIVTDAGLDKLDPDTEEVTPVVMDYNFSIGSLYSIEEDKRGYIWLSSSLGIHRLHPLDNTLIEFGEESAMGKNLYNPKASHRLSDGRIVFGGVNGFSIILPQQVQRNTNAANPVFADLILSNEPVEIGKHEGRTILNKNLNSKGAVVQLSYQDRGIGFTVSSTEFTAPGRNKYAYKLEGLDERWNYVDATQRNILYTSLPGGEYQLKLKAANSSGIWDEDKIRTIDLIVKPPFWKTTWFILLITALVVGSILAINRFLLNRQKENMNVKPWSRNKKFSS